MEDKQPFSKGPNWKFVVPSKNLNDLWFNGQKVTKKIYIILEKNISVKLKHYHLFPKKGDKMVPTGSQRRKSRFADSGMKGFVTKKGSLRIPSIGYQDAGIYTCMGNFYLKISWNFTKICKKLIQEADLTKNFNTSCKNLHEFVVWKNF